MKSTLYYYSCFVVALLLSSCGDKADFRTSSISPASSGARVKVYHAAPDAPGIVVYVNDKVFTGVNTVPTNPASLPAAFTYFNVFPTQDYAVLTTTGTAKVAVNAAATATTSETAVLTGTLPVVDGTYYSVFITGTAPTYETLVLTDKLMAADAGKAYVRVVDLVPNSPAGGYDVTLNGSTLVNVPAYKAATDFIPVTPIPLNTAAQVVTAKNGTTTLTLTNGLQPTAGRFYTLIIRGVAGNTKTPVTVSASVNL